MMQRDEMDTCEVDFNEDIEVYDQHNFEEEMLFYYYYI